MCDECYRGSVHKDGECFLLYDVGLDQISSQMNYENVKIDQLKKLEKLKSSMQDTLEGSFKKLSESMGSLKPKVTSL
jgi:hypothetical protein